MKYLFAIFLLLLSLQTALAETDASVTRYLSLQVFTGSAHDAIPPPQGELENIVEGIRDSVGATGDAARHLGFIIGPLSFDVSDANLHQLIALSFDIALKTDMAVGFHIDDMMFWDRLEYLRTRENIEWLDWKGTPNTGRRLDWSSKPLKVAPQLCLNAKAVRQAVAARAHFIGAAVAEGVKKLAQAGKPELFMGVIAGWETMIGQDFDTGQPLGYCALTNAGFSEGKPPADLNAARNDIIRDFTGFWAQNLADAGVPADKIYSHAAYTSREARKLAAQKLDNVPDWSQTAFANGVVPGFSTYPQPGEVSAIAEEAAKHGGRWISSEGTAIDPGAAEQGGPDVGMENYLGNLFNHGATLVNIYGWVVGPADNPFRSLAESEAAIHAYRKFLHGEALTDKPYAADTFPSPTLIAKLRRVQTEAPAFAQKYGPGDLQALGSQLDAHLKKHELKEAEQTADQMLKIVDTPPAK